MSDERRFVWVLEGEICVGPLTQYVDARRWCRKQDLSISRLVWTVEDSMNSEGTLACTSVEVESDKYDEDDVYVTVHYSAYGVTVTVDEPLYDD